MRIAQISPLQESVPPRTYGGTERIVSYLTEALVRQGHEVTLFASGDSKTSAKLFPFCKSGLRLAKELSYELTYFNLMGEELCRRAHEFDIVHNHIEHFLYGAVRRCKVPTVTTLHGRLDLPFLQPLYREYSDMPLVSISDNQRLPIPFAKWVNTIHHGVPKNLYQFEDKPKEHLACVGRICPEKGIDKAIKIAIEADMPLKIAAKVCPTEEEYYINVIKPLLKHPLIEYVGEITEHEKSEFYGSAKAVLFTIDWPEPFGLVMIEAMACGTPVIANRRGSVSEVIEDGVTGFILDNEAQAVQAINTISKIDRKRCREVFEERFTDDRMARDYVKIYEQVARKESSHVSKR